MPSVYTFSRSDNEIMQELLQVFSSGRGTAREQCSMQAELLVEPVGWDALWKLSKTFCKKMEVRYPCIAYVAVTSVDFENLSACVDVLSVQHESVSLPENIVDVPLIELWPTMKQREQCINVATTAEFIDLLRFYYNDIWMPWDDADDKVLLPNTIEERMQLWSDMHNGTIPNCVARSITLLRNSAIYAHEKLRQLDSSLCEGDLANDDEVRYPCIAYVAVTSVDFENLSACVDVLSVQHESVSLPENIVDVPLIELWPTMKQREQCINVATTAEFIDLLRFYYNDIWMPWDDADDKVLLPNTIEERMQLWSDMHNGTIPNCVARSITLLRNSAIYAHEKLRQLDSSLCEGDLANDDDSLLPPSYISLYAEMNARLDGLMSKWTLYENSLIREPYLARERAKWQKNKSKKNVVALWEGGSIFEFGEISKFLASHLTSEYHLSMMRSADDALTLEPEELVVCGHSHQVPEVPLSNINITSFNDAALEASDMRSCLLMLSEECRLRQLRLLCTSVNTVIVMKSGRLHVFGCIIQDQSSSSQSDFAQGIVAMSGAKILIEDCTFDNFYSGIVVHKGAQVELRNCKIRNCGVGIQMYSGSQVELTETTIENCSEHSIRCEIDTKLETIAEKHAGVNGVEGLLVNNNCKIGTGNLQKEVLVVQQDISI